MAQTMIPALEVVADLDALTARAVERVLAAMEASPYGFRFGLCGGHTPEGLYRALARPPAEGRVPWERVIVFLGDERRVPDDDPRSNFGFVKRVFLDDVRLPMAGVLKPKAALPDGDAAAAAYEKLLRREMGTTPVDFLLLGLGEDGHIASIFPSSPALDEKDRWVMSVPAPTTVGPRVPRLTLTPVRILEAREVLVLVSGAGKAAAVARALAAEGDERACPARLLHRAGGKVTFLCDRAAAARIALA